MRDAFVARLEELAKADPRVMLLTGDLGFGVLNRFAAALPDQYLNVGVAEQNLTAVATGLALEGNIVFTYSIGNFPTLRCLEQVRNDACYHDANVKIVCIGGGFSYGPLGPSHHATEDIAILRSLPNITVFSPTDTWEVAGATAAMIETPGVCYLRLDKSVSGFSARPGEVFTPGRARTLRDGRDLTIIATGGIAGEALAAAKLLAARGIQCRVVSMHTIVPLDTDALDAASRETGGIVTLEEHSVIGGLGGAVAEHCLESGNVPVHFARFGLRGGFSSVVGSQAYLRKVYGLDADSVAAGIETLLRSGNAAAVA